MVLMKQLIFYASFLYFPFVITMGWLMIKRSGFYRWGALSLVILASVPAYARFVEPRFLRTIEAEIALAGSPAEGGDDIRLLLFSDTHIGMFGNTMPLERIRERADTLDFDAVLLAGDLTYHLPEDQIEAAFHELNNFGKPVFVVFGNHDVGFPGPDLGMQLAGYFATLENVHLLNNRTEIVNLNGREIWLTGTSDLWQGQIEYPTENPPAGTPRIILTTIRTSRCVSRQTYGMTYYLQGTRMEVRSEFLACISALYPRNTGLIAGSMKTSRLRLPMPSPRPIRSTSRPAPAWLVFPCAC